MKERRKPENPEKTPRDELQKMSQTAARRSMPQGRLEPAQQHWWQARKEDVLTVTPRVASFGMVSVSQGQGSRGLLFVGCLTSPQHASVSQGQGSRGLFVGCLTSPQHASVSQGQGSRGLLFVVA